MIRAVVDPGVLVSAFIGRAGSVPDRIVRGWRAGRIEPGGVAWPARGAVRRARATELRKCCREGRAIDFVEALRVGASLVNDPPATEAISCDPKDDYLVGLARSSAATALVSGDRDLLEANIGDIEIPDAARVHRPA